MTLRTWGRLNAQAVPIQVCCDQAAAMEAEEAKDSKAIKDGLPLEEAKLLVLKDPRVASRARDTKGFESNIGKYVSLAYLEAEAAGF